MAPPPPDLMDELIEEFLLRLPPDDPASLARAALVCRRWRCIISSPCFRRRLRGLHRPPMLGFLSYNGGCSHIDCRRGPFLVVFMCASSDKTFACVYSSEAGVWSEHAYDEPIYYFTLAPAVLMGGALHVLSIQDTMPNQDTMIMIFKYDLATSGMSEIDVPDALCPQEIVVALMTTEDGRLGLTFVEGSRLYLWAREADSRGVWGWAVSRVVELEMLLPVDALSESLDVFGFAECAGFILLRTVIGFFAIDPKSGQVRKVAGDEGTFSLVPYESFCLPALGASSAGEGPKAGV